MQVLSLEPGLFFDIPEPLRKFIGCCVQRPFRVDVQIAADVDKAEEKITHFRFHLGLIPGLNRLPELFQLFLQFDDGALDLIPLETDLGGLVLNTFSPQQRRQVFRNSVEKRSVILAWFLLHFDGFPVCQHVLYRFDSSIAENMGMAADHFLTDGCDHVIHGELPGFGADLGMEHDLQQQIAQFFGHGGKVFSSMASITSYASSSK